MLPSDCIFTRFRFMGLTVTVAGLFLTTRVGAEPPVQEWVARYVGDGVGNNQTTAMAVDPSGNVYVTGYSSGTWWDIVTIKYDSQGHQVWLARYDGVGHGDDVPYALVLDANGNTYVTGYTDGNGQYNYDYLTLKYSSVGTLLWDKRYAGSGNFGLDEAFAIAVDANGNVLVTGDSFESATDHDYATVKYGSNGQQVWVARYNGPANSGDGANGIVLDPDGNAYVTGVSQHAGGAGNMDVATVKYSAAGVQQWTARYNGPGNGNDGGIGIALDGQRNVYVAGFSDGGAASRSDETLIKYQQNGTELWVRREDGPAHSYDALLAIVLDSSANVYATGYILTAGNGSDYSTLKFDSDGQLLWDRPYDGPAHGYDEGQAIVLDASGNVYVTGYSDGGGDMVNYDYATMKYDATGAEQWVTRYNGPGDNIDVAAGIALDRDSHVIVAGWSTGNAPPLVDMTTIKYDQAVGAGVANSEFARGARVVVQPNPVRTSGRASLDVHTAGTLRWRLYTATGVLVWEKGSIPAGSGGFGHEIAIDARDLNPGMYFLEVRGRGIREESKIAVAR